MAYECILCACCARVLPVLLVESDKFMGPSGPAAGYRFIADSRDTASAERLDFPRQVAFYRPYARTVAELHRGARRD